MALEYITKQCIAKWWYTLVEAADFLEFSSAADAFPSNSKLVDKITPHGASIYNKVMYIMQIPLFTIELLITLC